MTISGYAWGHIVATGPQLLSAGTSAPLILTHNLIQFDAKAVNDQQAALAVSSTNCEWLCKCRLKPLAVSSFPARTAHLVSRCQAQSWPAGGHWGDAPNWDPSPVPAALRNPL